MIWKERRVNVHEDELQKMEVLKKNNNDNDDDNDDDYNDGDVMVSSVLCVTESTAAAGGMHLLQGRYVQRLSSKIHKYKYKHK